MCCKSAILRIILFIFLLCGLQCHANAQAEGYPVATGLAFMSNEFYNPQALFTEGVVEGKVLHRGNLGVFNDVSTTYAQFTLNLSSISGKDSASNRYLGIHVESDREGRLLSRNRGYLQFAQHLSIADDWDISLGAMLGGLNLIFQSTSITPGVSASAWDGAAGVSSTYKKKYTFGASVVQMFNTSLISVNQTTVLQRFISLYADASLVERPQYQCNVYGRSWFRDGEILLADGGVYGTFFNYLRAGVGYRMQQGAVVHLGLDDIRIGGGRAVFLTSFEFPVASAHRLPQESYELVLMYFL